MSVSKWTEEIGEELIRLVGQGKMLTVICKKVGITTPTLHNWKNPKKSGYKKEFAEKYEEAYKNSAGVIEAEILTIADNTSRDTYDDVNKSGVTVKRPNNASVQRDKLRIDVRFRMMTVRDRDRYGKLDTVKHEGNPDQPIVVTNFGDKKVPEKKPMGMNRISKEN